MIADQGYAGDRMRIKGLKKGIRLNWRMPFVMIHFMKMKVYADNAATTKLCDEAYEAMLPYLRDNFCNPSGVYTEGVRARSAVNEARHVIAESLGAYDREIIFTAGGSEADNMALVGAMEAEGTKGRHIVTTNIEHHAVLNTCKYLESRGYRVTYVKAGENGVVDPKDIEAAICDDTALVSVMFANNEIGTIQPVEEIGKICREHGILFHTDAVQAYGKINIDVNSLNVDMLSASAHKFGGPKGAGFLYVKRGTSMTSFVHGGSQEFSLRGGTENVPAIVGMAAAAEVSLGNMQEAALHERKLIKYLYDEIIKAIPNVFLNSDLDKGLPGILNLTMPGVNGDSLLITLDMKGIAASTGSACAMSLEEPSHVLQAIGRGEEGAKSSIRISLGPDNTLEEMDYIVSSLKDSVEYLRSIKA